MKGLALSLLLMLCLSLAATTRIVDINGTGQYTSIQTAVNACAPGDTVLVYPGRYLESTTVVQKNNLVICSLEALTGDPLYISTTIIDAQLMSFKKNVANKGKIMNRGLWRYTRHPNYFGEACMWWGIFLLTLQVAQGWLALLSPVVMSVLLIRVSGVPMLERKYQDNPEYQDYILRTSSFFPLPPR